MLRLIFIFNFCPWMSYVQNEFNGNILLIVMVDLKDQNKLCFAKWADFWAKFQWVGKKTVYKTSKYKLEVNWVASLLLWKVKRSLICYSKTVIISTDQAKLKNLFFLGNGQIRRTIWISTIFPSKNVFCFWQF